MSGEDERRLGEEEARRLWRRAAELQAEAARRLEERSRSIAGDEGGDGTAVVEDEGYTLADVRAAAVEAGIGEEFMGRALAEQEGRGEVVERSRTDELADLVLGEGPRELVVSRVYDAPPAEVYRVLQRILPSPPSELVLRDVRGGHPLEGGVLILDVPPMELGRSEGIGYELRGWGDVKEVHLSLRPVGGEEKRTEVTLAAPLDHSRRVNLWVGGALSGLLGLPVAGGAAALAGAGAGALGLVGLLVVVAAVVTGTLTFGAAGFVGTRIWTRVWHYGLHRAERALGDVLTRVGAHISGGGAVGMGEHGWPALGPGAGEAGREGL